MPSNDFPVAAKTPARRASKGIFERSKIPSLARRAGVERFRV
jgi:hypothetical protein